MKVNGKLTSCLSDDRVDFCDHLFYRRCVCVWGGGSSSNLLLFAPLSPSPFSLFLSLLSLLSNYQFLSLLLSLAVIIVFFLLQISSSIVKKNLPSCYLKSDMITYYKKKKFFIHTSSFYTLFPMGCSVVRVVYFFL